jgi:hypothetical protein
MRNTSIAKYVVIAAAGFVTTIFNAGESYAQAPQSARRPPQLSRRSRPTVSPYLGLLNNNGGNDNDASGGLNYYNLVRPRQQAQKAANGFARELQAVESNVRELKNPEMQPMAPVISTGRMAPTGHAATFGNLGNYYPGQGRR